MLQLLFGQLLRKIVRTCESIFKGLGNFRLRYHFFTVTRKFPRLGNKTISFRLFRVFLLLRGFFRLFRAFLTFYHFRDSEISESLEIIMFCFEFFRLFLSQNEMVQYFASNQCGTNLRWKSSFQDWTQQGSVPLNVFLLIYTHGH